MPESKHYNRNKTRFAALTLIEMVIAMSIIVIILAAILPQFRSFQKSFDSKRSSAEILQNGRILTDHIQRNLMKAAKITAVSDSAEANGYIQFQDNDENEKRYQLTDSYVQFGDPADLDDLAGPATKLQFTCYALDDLNTTTTDPNSIRLVKVDATITNPSQPSHEKNFTATAYLHVDQDTDESFTVTKIYWADEQGGKIQRANLDGTNTEDLILVNRMKPKAMALDLTARKLYWADEETNKIQRSNLDGSNIEDLILVNRMKPRALALDISAGKMYWADEETKKIHRANLDGSNIEDLITKVDRPRAIALDVDSNKIYWADEQGGKIQRANLDGTNTEDLISVNRMKPKAMALDLTARKLYWADEETNKIQRSNLDGSNIEDLISPKKTEPRGKKKKPNAKKMKPRALALDIIAGKMYWADEETKKIHRANLDGSNIEDLITKVDRPRAIALD